jgi:hypothetical protein
MKEGEYFNEWKSEKYQKNTVYLFYDDFAQKLMLYIGFMIRILINPKQISLSLFANLSTVHYFEYLIGLLNDNTTHDWTYQYVKKTIAMKIIDF